MTRDLKAAALVSLLIVLPFAVLEVVNTTVTDARGFAVLFGFLWFLPVLFYLAVVPVMRNPRAMPYLQMALRIGAGVGLALVWASLLIDQLPCFLGVANCD